MSKFILKRGSYQWVFETLDSKLLMSFACCVSWLFTTVGVPPSRIMRNPPSGTYPSGSSTELDWVWSPSGYSIRRFHPAGFHWQFTFVLPHTEIVLDVCPKLVSLSSRCCSQMSLTKSFIDLNSFGSTPLRSARCTVANIISLPTLTTISPGYHCGF